MRNPVILVGVGEMGGVFARGFLRSGHSVIPVLRTDTLQKVADEITDPELIIVAVGEADLHPVLEQLPAVWKDRLVLLQNELLPSDWNKYELDPTVISVWFEKKKGQDAKVLIPSPAFGKHAQLISDALGSIDIATNVLTNAEQLLFELVVKNVYILTTNIAGLQVGGTVGELRENYEQLMNDVAGEIIQLQEKLTGETFENEKLMEAMLVAFEGDLEHKCMGRSAPARLERALKLADGFGLELETLKRIDAEKR